MITAVAPKDRGFELNRRQFVTGVGSGIAVLTLVPLQADATSAAVAKLVAKIVGDRTAHDRNFTISLPEIAENGNSVSLRVALDSPMSDVDFVTAIHIFSEGNPLPDVAEYYLSPNSGKAEITLRVRLFQSQKLVFVAETSKNEVFVTRRAIKVTLGGCGG